MNRDGDRSLAGQQAARCSRRVLNLLALGYWALGLVNVGRSWQATVNVELLARWEPAWPSWALATVSGLFALAFLTAGWGLLRRRPWGRDLALWLPPAYGLIRIATVLLTSVTPYARARWLWLLIGWVFGSLLVGSLLGLGPLRHCFRPDRAGDGAG
jgi:hypothetical protein